VRAVTQGFDESLDIPPRGGAGRVRRSRGAARREAYRRCSSVLRSALERRAGRWRRRVAASTASCGIADATGIPLHDGGAGPGCRPEIRERAGVNEFYELGIRGRSLTN